MTRYTRNKKRVQNEKLPTEPKSKQRKEKQLVVQTETTEQSINDIDVETEKKEDKIVVDSTATMNDKNDADFLGLVNKIVESKMSDQRKESHDMNSMSSIHDMINKIVDEKLSVSKSYVCPWEGECPCCSYWETKDGDQRGRGRGRGNGRGNGRGRGRGRGASNDFRGSRGRSFRGGHGYYGYGQGPYGFNF